MRILYEKEREEGREGEQKPIPGDKNSRGEKERKKEGGERKKNRWEVVKAHLLKGNVVYVQKRYS